MSEPTPRQRLFQRGPDALTDAELLSVLLRGRGDSAIEAAERILEAVSGLPGLLVADRVALRRCGATDAQTAAILASIGMQRRLARWRVKYRSLLDHPGAVAAHVILEYPTVDQEVLGALFLDIRNRLIASRELFRGTLSRCAVEPRQILREALEHRAHAVMLWHLHPSGDPLPSDDDEHFTHRVRECCELLGVRLLDHVIVGANGQFVSMHRLKRWAR